MVWKKFDNMFSRFDKIHERDRQTNRQTDKYRMTAQAALMHSIALQKNRFCRFKTAKFTNEQRWYKLICQFPVAPKQLEKGYASA